MWHRVVILTIINILSSLSEPVIESEEIRRHADLCKLVVIAHRGASGYIPEHTLAA